MCTVRVRPNRVQRAIWMLLLRSASLRPLPSNTLWWICQAKAVDLWMYIGKAVLQRDNRRGCIWWSCRFPIVPVDDSLNTSALTQSPPPVVEDAVLGQKIVGGTVKASKGRVSSTACQVVVSSVRRGCNVTDGRFLLQRTAFPRRSGVR